MQFKEQNPIKALRHGPVTSAIAGKNSRKVFWQVPGTLSRTWQESKPAQLLPQAGPPASPHSSECPQDVPDQVCNRGIAKGTVQLGSVGPPTGMLESHGRACTDLSTCSNSVRRVSETLVRLEDSLGLRTAVLLFRVLRVLLSCFIRGDDLLQ